MEQQLPKTIELLTQLQMPGRAKKRNIALTWRVVSIRGEAGWLKQKNCLCRVTKPHLKLSVIIVEHNVNIRYYILFKDPDWNHLQQSLGSAC